MATDPLYSETADTLPVDFHSTRRAYCTALAKAGCNSQTAQVLAGHSSAAVHQRYVAAETIRELPPSAMLQLPEVLAGSVPKLDPAPESFLNDFAAPAAGLEPATRRLTGSPEAHDCNDSEGIARHENGADDCPDASKSPACQIVVPNSQPGLSKAVDPSFRRVRELALELASAAEQGSTDRVESLIGRLALEHLPRQQPAADHTTALSCEGRAS
jgi:hypothetical protein